MLKKTDLIALFLTSAVIGVGISYSKVYLFHVLLFLLFITGAYLLSTKKYKVEKTQTNVHLFLCAFFAWYLLSGIWSINKEYYLFYMFYLIFGLSIVFTTVYLVKNSDEQNHLFKWLAVIFCIQVGIAFLEMFGIMRWPISPYSSLIHYFGRSGVDLSLYNDYVVSILSTTPTGFAWNPNNLSGNIMLILPFFLMSTKNSIKLIGLVIGFFMVVFVGSRAAFLAFLITFVLWFLISKTKARVIGLSFLLVFLFVMFNPFYKGSPRYQYRLNRLKSTFSSIRGSITGKQMVRTSDEEGAFYIEIDVSTTGSIGVRRILIMNGLDALHESNYLGIGAGNSKTIQERIGNTRYITSMHNFWAELLVEGGIFGLFFAVWYFYLIFCLYKIKKSAVDAKLKYFSGALSLGLLSYSVAMIGSSSVIYNLTMWLALGFAMLTINNYKKECLTNIK